MLWQVIHGNSGKSYSEIHCFNDMSTISLKIRHSALSERTIKTIIWHNDPDVRVKTSTLLI